MPKDKISYVPYNKRNFASRWFGYDIFLSFALGPPPRGTHSYASDLARRLQEQDFTVFFSEQEMPPGEQLDSALQKALLRSKALVVIANDGTLREPRWVRKEVEEFRQRHPNRPVIPINVGTALQDPALAESAQEWLDYQGKVWVDEVVEAVVAGIASEGVIKRLVNVPTRAKSNVKWRWLVGVVVASLFGLAIAAGGAAWIANHNAKEATRQRVAAEDAADKARKAEKRARDELRHATVLRLYAEAQAMLSGARSGGYERALLQLLAAQRLIPGAEAEGGILSELERSWHLRKVVDVGFALQAVAFSPNGERIVSGSANGTLHIWDATTLQPNAGPLQGHSGPVKLVLFGPDDDELVSFSEDGTVRRWSSKSGQAVGAPQKGFKDMAAFAISPDGTKFVYSTKANSSMLQLFNAKTSYATPLQVQHQDGVRCAAFSPDGNRIVSGGDQTLRIWDANTGKPIGTPLQGHQRAVASVAFSPDGGRIVSGSWDQTLRIWDANTGQLTGAPLHGHLGGVTSVAFSPDGQRIVSIDSDQTLRLWDSNLADSFGTRLQGHDGRVTRIAVSPDGRRIVSGGEDGTVRLWDTETGQPLGAPLQAHREAVWHLAFSPDGRQFVSGGLNWPVRIWNTERGDSVGELFDGKTGRVTSLAFSTDGKHIMSGASDGTLRLWDTKSGDPLGPPKSGHTGHVTSIAFSGDGKRIVSIGDRSLRLWDAKTIEAIGAPLQGHERGVSSVAISPDGSRIISSGQDKFLLLWDTKTDNPVGMRLYGHNGSVRDAAFSPDSNHIVSGSVDGTLCLWDAKTGQLHGAPLQAHRLGVDCIAFSPDGSRILSGGADGTLRLWNARTGQQIGAPLQADKVLIEHIAFNSDGSRIVSHGWEGLRVWPGPKLWADELCKKLTRNMSRKQWHEWVSTEIPYACQCSGLPIPDEGSAITASSETCKVEQ